MSYTDEEVRQIALDSFQTGRRVERAARQSDLDRTYSRGFVHGAEVAQDPAAYADDLMGLAESAGVTGLEDPKTRTARSDLATRTRGHLTLIQGGKR